MKIFNRKDLIITSAILIVIGILALAGCSNSTVSKSNIAVQKQMKNSDKSIADTNVTGTLDKLDKNPIYTPNPIKDTSTVPLPVKITDIRVQDNVNAMDHVEITLINTGKLDLKNFDCYIAEVDTVTKAKEEYYVKLIGFILGNGATKTLYFDNKSGYLSGVIKPISQAQMDKISQDTKNGDLHYNGSMNGTYGTAKNEVIFTGQIHDKNYASLDFSTIEVNGIGK